MCALEDLSAHGGKPVPTGRWRGLPVAIKTQVFEAWVGGDDGEGAGAPGGAASKAQLKYVRAIMETAISASVGHRNVVRALASSFVCALLAGTRIFIAPQSHHAHAQVATYHYDIKRMDEQMDATSGLQV